ELDVALVVDAHFDERVDALEAGELSLVYDSGTGDAAMRRIRAVVGAYADSLLAERLARMQLPAAVTEPVHVRQVDRATEQEVIGRILGGVLPYLFLL